MIPTAPYFTGTYGGHGSDVIGPFFLPQFRFRQLSDQGSKQQALNR